METLNLNSLSDETIIELINLSFNYYNEYQSTDQYEAILNEFFERNKNQAETKPILNTLIDLISRLVDSEKKEIETELKHYNFKFSETELFKSLLNSNKQQIVMFKLRKFGKNIQGRVLDFNHSFYSKNLYNFS